MALTFRNKDGKQVITCNNYASHLIFKEEQRKVIDQLPEEVKVYGAIVGDWIWIWYDDQLTILKMAKHNNLLKRLGFFWNGRRKCWQNPCGIESERSVYDPRRKYLVKPLSDSKRPLGYIAKEFTESELQENGCPF